MFPLLLGSVMLLRPILWYICNFAKFDHDEALCAKLLSRGARYNVSYNNWQLCILIPLRGHSSSYSRYFWGYLVLMYFESSFLFCNIMWKIWKMHRRFMGVDNVNLIFQRAVNVLQLLVLLVLFNWALSLWDLRRS